MRDGPTTVNRPLRSASRILRSRSRTNANTAFRPVWGGLNRTIRARPASGYCLRLAIHLSSVSKMRPAAIRTLIAKIDRQLERQVFVEFELHDARIGTSCSSCANSAAYAKAALMWCG